MGPGDEAELDDWAELRSDQETPEGVVEAFFELPSGAQLGVLRTVVPRALGALDPGRREGFLRTLREEIDRTALGEETYDIRTEAPGGERHLARRGIVLHRFLARIATKLPNGPPPAAIRDGVVAVLCALGSRITSDEFENLMAQLPRNLRDLIQDSPPEPVRPRILDADSFVQRIADDVCDGDSDRAFRLCAAVFRTLVESLGNAAIKARRQLPLDYLRFFQAPPPQPPP